MLQQRLVNYKSIQMDGKADIYIWIDREKQHTLFLQFPFLQLSPPPAVSLLMLSAGVPHDPNI